MHYSRWKRTGNHLVVAHPRYDDPVEAFEARTEWRDGCLVWTGSKSTSGYGIINDAAKRYHVHRWAYIRKHGPIPIDMYVDHKCHNKPCCNVAHLRLVTKKQNAENVSGLRTTNTSGYSNVVWSKAKKRWVVAVTHHGRVHWGGQFLREDVDKANEAAVELKNKLFTHNDKDRQ